MAEETTGTYDFVEDVVEEGDYYGFMKAFEEPRIRYIFEIGEFKRFEEDVER